eukprot:Nk52_evm34s370 gene=Nk52_evmTU34s370
MNKGKLGPVIESPKASSECMESDISAPKEEDAIDDLNSGLEEQESDSDESDASTSVTESSSEEGIELLDPVSPTDYDHQSEKSRDNAPTKQEVVKDTVVDLCIRTWKKFTYPGENTVPFWRIKDMLEDLGFSLSQVELFNICMKIDPNNSGYVTFSELLALKKKLDNPLDDKNKLNARAFAAVGGNLDGTGKGDLRLAIKFLKNVEFPTQEVEKQLQVEVFGSSNDIKPTMKNKYLSLLSHQAEAAKSSQSKKFSSKQTKDKANIFSSMTGAKNTGLKGADKTIEKAVEEDIPIENGLGLKASAPKTETPTTFTFEQLELMIEQLKLKNVGDPFVRKKEKKMAKIMKQAKNTAKMKILAQFSSALQSRESNMESSISIDMKGSVKDEGTIDEEDEAGEDGGDAEATFEAMNEVNGYFLKNIMSKSFIAEKKPDDSSSPPQSLPISRTESLAKILQDDEPLSPP